MELSVTPKAEETPARPYGLAINSTMTMLPSQSNGQSVGNFQMMFTTSCAGEACIGHSILMRVDQIPPCTGRLDV